MDPKPSLLISLILVMFTTSLTAQTEPYGANDMAAQRLHIGDTEIYYEVYGEGSPILLLHGGFYGYIDEFSEYIDCLSKQYRVIALATRGHGRCPIGSTPYTRRLLADDAAAVLKQTTDQPAIVIGFSCGAKTAYMVAAHYPDQVKKVVAIGAGPRVSESAINWAKNLSPTTVAAHKQWMPEPDRWDDFVENIQHLYLHHGGVSDQELQQITCPLLLIAGDRDYFNPVSEFDRANSIIQNSQLLVLPDCDHVGSMSKPIVLREFILPFIQEK